MLFARLLLSPMPHARVKRLDTREAASMPGVRAILTADDLPQGQPKPGVVEVTQAVQGPALTNEPVYEGEPILAVAAESELIAAEAIEKIQIEFEPLPFVVDVLASLRPGGPNARTQGNVWARLDPASAEARGLKGPDAVVALLPRIKELKWSEQDFAQAADGQLPIGEATDQWSFGDVDAGFKQADLVLDETFVSSSTSHQPLETRTAMAYWQNGKLFLHGSTQSTVQTVMSVARWVGIEPANVVIISEYTGGGFGSKIPGAVSMAIPALLSKQANAPVMMRITREEEHYIGRGRPGVHARLKVGFRNDGRITAVDMFVIVDNGPYDQQSDGRSAG